MPKRRSTHESGLAGEFFVMETLYRLGHQPALTLGNAKMVDILVRLQSGKTLRINVKTVRGGGKWGVGVDDLSLEVDLFFVFLLYRKFADVRARPVAFIVPAVDVQRLKEKWFRSFAVFCSNEERRRRLERFQEAWDLIGK